LIQLGRNEEALKIMNKIFEKNTNDLGALKIKYNALLGLKNF